MNQDTTAASGAAMPEALRLAVLLDAMDYDDTRAAAAELRRLHALSAAAPAVANACCNAWFASLPEGRQAVLRDDKWMLAHAAFEAGRAAAPSASQPAARIVAPFPGMDEPWPEEQKKRLAELCGEIFGWPQQGETAGAVYAELAEVWQHCADDCEASHGGMSADYYKGLAEGLRQCAKDLLAAAPHAAAASGAPDWEALRHCANEWADMATNGPQWLRNVADGTSDAKAALYHMEQNLTYCRLVNDAPAVQAAIRAAASGAPSGVPESPISLWLVTTPEGNTFTVHRRALAEVESEYAAKVEALQVMQPQAPVAAAPMSAPSDAEILALNHGEVHFSESPSRFPEAGHGTQYHAGAPGVLSFARAVLARWGSASPTTVQAGAPSIDDLCARIKAADDAAADRDYMLDSDDCIAVLRGTWTAPSAMDMPARPSHAAASGGEAPAEDAQSDVMVDAYLREQRRVVEEADRFGRPNVGGLHTNTVREACRAGIAAAMAAKSQKGAA